MAALLAFGVTYIVLRPAASAGTDEIAWMQKEFHLTPAQTAAIEKLHEDYHPVCMEHCKLIMQARQKLAASPSVEKAAAQAELTRLEAVCHDATQAHVQRVAAAMSPEEGARFLSLVGPKVSGQSHDAPLGLK
jgi:Spy/CpxP family protein refolding chaperone